ncbi:MAG: hypothetical protein V2G33_06525 [bacterium JZ-2024 1]
MEGWAVWLGAIFFLACLPPVTQKELEMLPPSPPWEGFSGGWRGIFDLAEKADFLDIMVIQMGVKVFVRFEGRYPKTFQELCESPYSPLKCADIPNVFANKPLVETPPGELGAVEFKILAPGDRGLRGVYWPSSPGRKGEMIILHRLKI